MEELVKVNGNEVLASSRDVAEKFGKKHAEVLYAIEGRTTTDVSGKVTIKNNGILMGGNSQLLKMFKKSEYIDSRGRKKYEYLMNRDGFSLLAMGFTGKEALEWKLKYINAFNIMEEKLKESNLLSEEERLKLMLFSKNPQEVAYASNRLVELATAPLLVTIEEQKPLVEFANKVSDTSNLIDMGKMAKLLKDEHINIGRNRLFDWLRRNEILMKNNMPYQRYIDGGYFQVKESTYTTPYGTKTQQTTYVTGKGQIYIAEKLRKEFGEAV